MRPSANCKSLIGQQTLRHRREPQGWLLDTFCTQTDLSTEVLDRLFQTVTNIRKWAPVEHCESLRDVWLATGWVILCRREAYNLCTRHDSVADKLRELPQNRQAKNKEVVRAPWPTGNSQPDKAHILTPSRPSTPHLEYCKLLRIAEVDGPHLVAVHERDESLQIYIIAHQEGLGSTCHNQEAELVLCVKAHPDRNRKRHNPPRYISIRDSHLNEVTNVLEGASLAAISVDSQGLALQCLDDEVRHDATLRKEHTSMIQLQGVSLFIVMSCLTILRVHAGAVSVEDPRNAHLNATFSGIAVAHGFGNSLSLVIARTRAERVDIAPVGLFLQSRGEDPRGFSTRGLHSLDVPIPAGAQGGPRKSQTLT